MLLSTSSSIFSRTSRWFFLLTLIYFLLISGVPVEAQTSTKKNTATEEKTEKTLSELMKKNPWYKITGFRSAKFGMNEKSVYRAIAKDFKIAKSKVAKKIHSSQKTITLTINVPDLFSTGGTALVVYILGHKSKDLMHVNVLWGKGAAAEKRDGKSVIETANTLRTHFLKKRYVEDKLVVNAQLSNTKTLVFRGKDKKGRMVTLFLTTPGKKAEETFEEAVNNISLLLSYIENPENPDVASPVEVKEGEF